MPHIATPYGAAVVSFLLLAVAPPACAEPTVDYDRQIRPLLADNCYACHGPDENHREGGFRLDQKDSAIAEADSGTPPIVPGDAESSEIYLRMVIDDEDLRMPPADSGKQLSEEQIELIRRWIDQGAAWQDHWAFIPPRQGALPNVKDKDWLKTPIDLFILARLQSEGLEPSPQADKTTLIRRVTFDLTGLPPTMAEVNAFLSDNSENAYERVIDRLLASPRYGEHMARYWLDAARYGDTHGLHLDNYREMWPYRDWVVRAFNDNLPFDQFVTKQLAGDLLANSTSDDLIATGFNRCHVTTNEGGSITEEVYVRNVVDRVVTTGTVFMGLTFECTRCHDHKYDPLTMRDFYSMFAFFNSLDGNAMDGNKARHAPIVKVPSPEQRDQLRDIGDQISVVREEIKQAIAEFDYDANQDDESMEQPQRHEHVWIEDDVPDAETTFSRGSTKTPWDFVTAPQPVFSGTHSLTLTAEGQSQQYFSGARAGLQIGENDTLFAYVFVDPNDPPREIMLQWNSGEWNHRAYWGENLIDWGKDDSTERRDYGDLPAVGEWVRLEVNAAHVGIAPGTELSGWAFTQFGGTVYWDKAGIVTATPQPNSRYTSLATWIRDQRITKPKELPEDVMKAVHANRQNRTEDQHKLLLEYFIENAYEEARETFKPLHVKIAKLETEHAKLDDQIGSTLVYKELAEPRPSYVLNRGEYDQRRDQVSRATPEILPPLPQSMPVNRLGLAQWLTESTHPLTARVTVNRLWQQVFGTGIVKTAEDFGSQGEPPSHPALLDFLAVNFVDSGWDLKALMKQFVMSATYQQSSRVTPELLERDSSNRLLARGPRYRLDAEMLRDQALAVGGLLMNKLGGPSVKPPQPDGLWFAVGYSGSNTVRFQQDEGPDKTHRRTLYTFIKRTAPPPQLSTFDAPSRELCTVRRERTNTPLQALLLLNDPQFVEAAGALARRAIDQADPTPEARAAYMFRLSTARNPVESEIKELVELFNDHLQTYQRNPRAAHALIAAGSPQPNATEVSELAAWTMTANLVLNLDEVVNKN